MTITDPKAQKQGVIDLLKHYQHIGGEGWESKLELPFTELEKYPDHHAILKDFELRGIVHIYKIPNEEEYSNKKLTELEQSMSTRQYRRLMSYVLTVKEKRLNIYDLYLDQMYETPEKPMGKGDIILSSESYNYKTGILVINPYRKVAIAKQGVASAKPRTNTDQCVFMKQIFRSDKSMRIGLGIHDLIPGLHKQIKPTEFQIKKFKNIQTEINKKFTEATGHKKLIISPENKFRINPAYLSKD